MVCLYVDDLLYTGTSKDMIAKGDYDERI